MRIACETQAQGDLNMDNLMNVNESWLIEIDRSNTNMTKTQPQDRNHYRPMLLHIINHRLNRNKSSRAVYQCDE